MGREVRGPEGPGEPLIAWVEYSRDLGARVVCSYGVWERGECLCQFRGQWRTLGLWRVTRDERAEHAWGHVIDGLARDARIVAASVAAAGAAGPSPL